MRLVKSLERGLGTLCALVSVVKPLFFQLFRSGLGVLLEHDESLGMKQWSEGHSCGLAKVSLVGWVGPKVALTGWLFILVQKCSKVNLAGWEQLQIRPRCCPKVNLTFWLLGEVALFEHSNAWEHSWG